MKPFKAISVLLIAILPLTANADDFASYPAEVYAGKITRPNFSGAQREFAFYKTRLGDAAKRKKAEFAGSWVVEQIGCGTSCTSTYVIDHRTGAIAVLPVGGEEQQQVIVYHRPDSNLMRATWFDGSWLTGRCMMGDWVMDNGALRELRVGPHEPREDCNG